MTIGNKKKHIVFEVHSGNIMDSKLHFAILLICLIVFNLRSDGRFSLADIEYSDQNLHLHIFSIM